MRLLALRLQSSQCLFVHLDVPIDHHLLKEDEVFYCHDLLEQTLMDPFWGTGLRHHEISRRDTQILYVCLQLTFDELFEFFVDFCVLKPILIFVLEDTAFLFDEADYWVFPNGGLQILGHNLENPLLRFTTHIDGYAEPIALPCHFLPLDLPFSLNLFFFN